MEGVFGGGGYPDQFDRPPQPAPATTTSPDMGSHEQMAEDTPGTGEKK